MIQLQRFKERVIRAVKRRPRFFIAILVTVQVLCLCCAFVVSAQGHQTRENSATASESDTNAVLADRLSEKIACVGLSRSSWLYELISAEYPDEKLDRYDSEAVFESAVKHGILSYYTDTEIVQPLTRRFVCSTMVKAFGYELPQDAERPSDVSEYDDYMTIAAYYGFFPDRIDRIYPEARITAEEFANLRNELKYRRILKGKTVLTFGDSIMHGSGNNNDGMGSMIAAKYGMNCTDYSVPGATMGIYNKHGHIPDQIRQAKSEHRTADVILLNGGTNDMVFTKIGNIAEGFDMSKTDETDYSGGFEKTMWMIRKYWGDVPVVYVRSHNMALAADDKEKKYGERGIELAKKWSAVTIDLYNDSELNTEDRVMNGLYTSVDTRKKVLTHDSIHPTALGYARYYLPPLAQALMKIFG